MTTSPRVASWSSGGDPSAALLKPDLVAPASGILGGTSADTGGVAWDFVTGTSAATAYAAGVAATLLSERDLSATEVRSAMATTAQPLTTGVIAAGAGRVRAGDATKPGLVYPLDAGDYRSWLEGRRTHLNTPSILLSGGRSGPPDGHQHRLARPLLLVTDGRLRASGDGDAECGPARPRRERDLSDHRVRRGQTARLDDGYVVWRGASGTLTRIPVLISR